MSETNLKIIRCPSCNSTRVSKLYTTKETILYCQNSKCETWGRKAFVTAPLESEQFGKEFREVPWEYFSDD